MSTTRYVCTIYMHRNYLKSGLVLDVFACLPYDAVNTISSNSYTEIFSILKVPLVQILNIYHVSLFVGYEVVSSWPSSQVPAQVPGVLLCSPDANAVFPPGGLPLVCLCLVCDWSG